MARLANRASTGHVLVWAALLSLSLAALRTDPAAAQSALETGEYRTTVERAVAEFDGGNYAEARGLFLRAHKIYPNARTLRGLGWTAFELRSYAECVRYLEAALASTEKPLTEEQHRQTTQMLERARAFIAHVELELEPRAARVLVDGVQVERTGAEPLTLQVGDHLIEVQAPGYLPERRAISIGGGEQLSMHFVLTEPVLVEREASTPAGQSPRDGEPRKRHWYTNPWLWSGVAVVAGGVGLGLALALRPEAKHQTAEAGRTLNTPNGGVLQTLGRW